MLIFRYKNKVDFDQDPELRKQAENGDIAFGTVDSWLIWNLTMETNMLLILLMQVGLYCLILYVAVG